MSEPTPPLPDELRELVETIRRDPLSDERVARLAARLGPLGNTGTGGGTAGTSGTGGAPPATTPRTFGSLSKIAAGLVVVGALGLGARALLRAPASSSPPPASTTSPSIVAPPPAASVTAPLAAPEPPPTAASTAPSVGKPAPLAKPGPSSDPVAEEEILGRARAALAADPSKALALTAQHAAKFPGGMLSQEREQIAIEALLALGRRADALTRAKRFAATWPRSPYVSRLRLRGLLE